MTYSSKRDTPKSTPIPAFNPAQSGEFAAAALAGACVPGVLIGRLAVWSWLSNEDEHRFTKDLDLAVARADLPAVRAWLRENRVATRELPIGGVAVRMDSADADDETNAIRVDFIDRTSEEYGDFGDLVTAAVADAQNRNQTVRVGKANLLVVSPTYLVLLKLIAGRRKDDDDVEDLLRQAEVDVDFIRATLTSHPNLAVFRSRFEDKLVRTGHARARRDYNLS